MIRRLQHDWDIGHLMVRQEPIVVGIKPDSPYISRNLIWRYRRLHGWHLVKAIRHTHNGKTAICLPASWLNVLRGRCAN